MNEFYELSDLYEKDITLETKCMECYKNYKFGLMYNVPCSGECFLYHKVVCKKCHDKFMKKY